MKSRWKLTKSNGQACKHKLPLAFILALDAFKLGGRLPHQKKFSAAGWPSNAVFEWWPWRELPTPPPRLRFGSASASAWITRP